MREIFMMFQPDARTGMCDKHLMYGIKHEDGGHLWRTI